MAETTDEAGRASDERAASWRGARVVALLLVLACPGTGAAQTAAVPAPDRSGGSLDGLLRSLQLKAKPTTAPDFVETSRPAGTDFIPVSRPHPERSDKPMTAAEVAATTEALDKARVAQQRRAGVKPQAVPLKPSGEAGKPRKTRVR